MGVALQQLASRLLPPANVRFLGYRADVADLLVASDVFVLASDWEGLPVSILEAMLCGLPVVATRVSGIPEAVTDGEEGWLVPPRDPARLAAAIGCLLDDPAAAIAMGRRGRQRVLRDFSLERAARATADLYREVVQRAAPARLTGVEAESNEVTGRPLTLFPRFLARRKRPAKRAA
jgi:glycosyltransferase involved in cell wall biosynthesis